MPAVLPSLRLSVPRSGLGAQKRSNKSGMRLTDMGVKHGGVLDESESFHRAVRGARVKRRCYGRDRVSMLSQSQSGRRFEPAGVSKSVRYSSISTVHRS